MNFQNNYTSDIINKNTGELSTSYLLSEQAQKYILEQLVNIYASPRKKEQSDSKRENVGKKWTIEEDDQLLDEYVNQRLKISEIAIIHGRKVAELDQD